MDPILSGIAEFATTLSYRQLPEKVVVTARERLLDTAGVAVDAFDCEPARIARSLAQPVADRRFAGRIVGSDSLVLAESAAFVNTAMIRYADLNDIIPGGHPSDMLGALFAIAPMIDASGERLMTATVVAYETFIRLNKSAPLREKGWDQGFCISVGTVAGLASLLGLSREVACHALAMTAVANPALRASRAGQLSMWKGVATAYAVRNAVFGIQLAHAGMTGPEAPFTGRHGFQEMISGPFAMVPFGTSEKDFLLPAAIKTKYWPVANSLQAVIWAGIEMHKQVSPADLASVVVETYHFSWKESGSEPAKWDPQTRETADHSIPYILARAMMRGNIDHSDFEPEAFLDPAMRPLLARIEVRAEAGIDRENRQEGTYHLRVKATDKAGKAFQVDIVNPIGHEKTPFSPKDFVAKFERLCEPKLGRERTAVALAKWQAIEKAQSVNDAFDALNIAQA